MDVNDTLKSFLSATEQLMKAAGTELKKLDEQMKKASPQEQIHYAKEVQNLDLVGRIYGLKKDVEKLKTDINQGKK